MRPDVWGAQTRLRLSNAFGTRAVTFDDVHVGLQSSGAALVPHTNRVISFSGKQSVVVAPGKSVLSDPVSLPWVKAPTDPMLANRKLAVSFHVGTDTGPITWHAKALTTSYLSAPHSGMHGGEDGEANFPLSTTSWFFLDEIEMAAPGTQTLVAFGDSITDGTASSLNGDDRWPDVLARRLHAAMGARYSVVNEGIGGNMVNGPADYAQKPFSGGPAALDRLERDVISLPNVVAVIWLEGINDFGNAGATTEQVADGVRDGVKRLRARIPGVKIFMGTLTSSLHSSNGNYGSPEVDQKRHAYNDFIRSAGIFDGVIDFDAATLDGPTGELTPEYQPNSTIGGPGDKLHPNRAGYAAMGNAVDLPLLAGRQTAAK